MQVKSYFLRTATEEQGPLTEEQVAQLFANGTVHRDMLCKVVGGSDWKTIDDYMPLLKYGTQLPNPITQVVRSEEPPAYRYGSTPPRLPSTASPAQMRVSVVDFDLTLS